MIDTFKMGYNELFSVASDETIVKFSFRQRFFFPFGTTLKCNTCVFVFQRTNNHNRILILCSLPSHSCIGVNAWPKRNPFWSVAPKKKKTFHKNGHRLLASKNNHYFMQSNRIFCLANNRIDAFSKMHFFSKRYRLLFTSEQPTWISTQLYNQFFSLICDKISICHVRIRYVVCVIINQIERRTQVNCNEFSFSYVKCGTWETKWSYHVGGHPVNGNIWVDLKSNFRNWKSSNCSG